MRFYTIFFLPKVQEDFIQFKGSIYTLYIQIKSIYLLWDFVIINTSFKHITKLDSFGRSNFEIINVLLYCFLRFILPQLCPSRLVKQLQFLWCHWQHHWGLNYLLYLVPPYTHIFSTILVLFMAYKIIIRQAYDVCRNFIKREYQRG